MFQSLVYVVLIVIAVAMAAKGTMDFNDARVKSCFEKTGYKADKNKPVDLAVNQSEEFYCFMKCTAYNYELIDDNGNISEDGINRYDSGLSADSDKKFKECAKRSPIIENCRDITYLLQCMDENKSN